MGLWVPLYKTCTGKTTHQAVCVSFFDRNQLIAWKTNRVDERKVSNLLLFSSSVVSVLSLSFLSTSPVLHSWLSDSNWVSSKSNLLTSETKSSHMFVLPESWARHLKATWKKIRDDQIKGHRMYSPKRIANKPSILTQELFELSLQKIVMFEIA